MKQRIKSTIDRACDTVINVCGAVSDAAYRAKSVHVWHSADGRVTPLAEMDDGWLRNAIGCVERGKAKGAKYTRVLPFMRAELADRMNRAHPWRVVTTGRTPANPHPIDGSDTAERYPSNDMFTTAGYLAPKGARKVVARLDAQARKLTELDTSSKSHVTRLEEIEALDRKKIRGAHDRIDSAEKRLYALEAVAHKPVPIVTPAMLRVVFRDAQGKARAFAHLLETALARVAREP